MVSRQICLIIGIIPMVGQLDNKSSLLWLTWQQIIIVGLARQRDVATSRLSRQWIIPTEVSSTVGCPYCSWLNLATGQPCYGWLDNELSLLVSQLGSKSSLLESAQHRVIPTRVSLTMGHPYQGGLINRSSLQAGRLDNRLSLLVGQLDSGLSRPSLPLYSISLFQLRFLIDNAKMLQQEFTASFKVVNESFSHNVIGLTYINMHQKACQQFPQ